MNEIPNDRKYTKTHEWFLANGPIVTMGITQFAADELTDITYVELPPLGTKVTVQEPFGEIMAAAVVVTIPLVILVLVFQNRIVEGLTAGSVKG